MTDPSEIMVLVPDEFGSLSVVGLADFAQRLENGESLEDALTNAGIDTIDVEPEKVARVRALNATGDAVAYWEA